jgi:hypothetical protein
VFFEVSRGRRDVMVRPRTPTPYGSHSCCTRTGGPERSLIRSNILLWVPLAAKRIAIWAGTWSRGASPRRCLSRIRYETGEAVWSPSPQRWPPGPRLVLIWLIWSEVPTPE